MRHLTIELTDGEAAALELAATAASMEPVDVLRGLIASHLVKAELANTTPAELRDAARQADLADRKRKIMAAAGIWKGRDLPQDGLAFQLTERAEW